MSSVSATVCSRRTSASIAFATPELGRAHGVVVERQRDQVADGFEQLLMLSGEGVRPRLDVSHTGPLTRAACRIVQIKRERSTPSDESSTRTGASPIRYPVISISPEARMA
jgi:hypothetical protein